MPSIEILPDRVANQIAAGEVIERPVAVIKELVENSLDAGATRIEVEFRNGGKAYMRVEDNGRGMTPDEALICLERHATSKIRSADDLRDVTSFGFRGEALPSIASVARFTLRTRHESHEHGTEITINGGKLLDKKDCGMPVGTRIEVAQLFNAVPARRKFLKTDATETAHITYNCRLFAIANPAVNFRVLENGREVFQSPSGLQLKERIGEIWGRQLAGELIPVEQFDEATGLRLAGLTAKPGVGRSTRRELITLVNRRPVDNRTLGFAVMDAYQGHLPKGRFPPAFLFLEISPREMDVNVHPAKREVRFRNEGAIRRFVLAAITETLNAHRDTQSAPASPKEKPGAEPAPADTSPAQAIPSSAAAAPAPRDSSPTGPAQVKPAEPRKADAPPPAPSAPPPQQTAAPDTPNSPETGDPPKVESSKQPWRLLSRLKERYALMETPRGLIILHLRQADQRIRYEQILKTFAEAAEVPSQGLLIAEPLEFEPLAAEALESNLSLLNQQGFAIEPFGRNFYRIEAVPTWLAADKAESFIRDLVDELRQRGTTGRKERMIAEQVAGLAVKESYRSSDPITAESIEILAGSLLECEVPHSSPFGKATYREISWSELERDFGS